MAEIGAQKWPLCMSAARQLVEELKLEYYADIKRLSFVEALYILRTKVGLGSGCPKDVTKPWKVVGHPMEEKINRLLQRSLQVQMGSVENTEFSEFILSNAALPVIGLVHYYLQHLGIKSEIVSGVFCFSTKPNSDCTPHVWLTIDGQIIDNTFVKTNSSDSAILFRIKSEELYFNEDLTTTTRKMFYGQDKFSDHRVSAPHSLKVFTEYARSASIEKFLVASLKIAAINPCVKMYDIVMKDYIRQDFNVVVEDLESKWNRKCWKCGTMESDASADQACPTSVMTSLKTCSGCKLAKYCGLVCQKQDWPLHKILHKEINHFAASIGLE